MAGYILDENEKNKIIRNYINSALAHEEATYRGDHRNVNKEAKKLIKIYQNMKNDKILAEEILSQLLINKNINVRIWSASHALRLNVKINEAEMILKEIAEMNDKGVLSFDAGMTLKQWKEGKMKI